ncbi:MAG: aspartate carbamoyltransferase catalytic subunit [Candidatus Dormibacteraceae bacterium]
MKHLLGIAELNRTEIEEILRIAETFVQLAQESKSKVSALRGKTVINLFFEDSTRTRVSFEMAGKLLSADVINFGSGGSSLSKGESLRDTVETISSMGFDALVVRHGSAGVPMQMLKWTDAAIINAGDGNHEHPTQALLDCLTLRQALNRRSFKGVHIAYVGDFTHSRVAHSGIYAFRALGADITVVAPPTLLPYDMSPWPVTVTHNLDEVLADVDIIYTVRPKSERITEALFPSLDEYITMYGITDERFARLDERVLLMEAGPLVRGIQMSDDVADHMRNLMNRQVTNGVAVRMAVLTMLLNGELDG